jgi:hypothetical protein
MFIKTRTSLYRAEITPQGYRVEKIAIIPGNPSAIEEGKEFVGNILELGERLTLYNRGKIVLETTSIIGI